MSLNPRQKKFAQFYHALGNATKAYGQAYDSPTLEDGNYPNWVSVDGNRLLRNDKIQAELERLRGETAAIAAMDRTQVIDYLILAINTPGSEIGPDSPLCEEYEVKPDGTIKTKSVSKVAAIKELARLTGMYAPDKVQVTAEGELVEMLRALTGSKKGK